MAPYFFCSLNFTLSVVSPYNYPIPIANETQPNKTIHEEMLSCLEFDRHVKEPIIETLPTTIVEDMKTHLIEENNLSLKYQKHELSPADYENLTASYLFELLNYSEFVAKQFRGKTEGTQEWQDAEDIVAVSNALCKISRYPQEYGLNIDIRSRIPDGVYVGMNKKGDFSIYGLAEAKLGALDERSISQLQLSGSRTTMATIAEQIDEMLNEKSDEELHPDLLELKQVLNGRHLTVKWKNENGKEKLSMGLDLLIPTRGGSEGLFEQRVTFKNQTVESQFTNLYDNDRVEPKNSPFSAAEVHTMAKKILAEMEF